MALIEISVYAGWSVEDIRSKLKGDNGAIGVEVAEARRRLGLEPEPPRVLYVRDNGAPVRVIPFRETDPELAYEPPDV